MRERPSRGNSADRVRPGLLAEQRRERQPAEAQPGVAEERPAGRQKELTDS
jgi:hypothetical protein